MDTKRYFAECVKSISEIVKFDSAQAPALPGMPFGKGAAESLDYFLRLAKNMGFETQNYDNYVGEVLFGEGEEFAILCHLDVVPAGTGWTHDPFGGEIENDNLYGRGTMDDKGPAVICLYCMKALKDEGFLPRKKIKLIVGCNEESGWQCIDYYKKKTQMPAIGFSPDADFPVIWAEKGILQLRLQFPLENAPFTTLSGGERANMVCDFAFAEGVRFDNAAAAKHGVAAEKDRLVARGRSAHASTPAEGDNALKKLFGYFAEQDERVAAIYGFLFEDELGLTKLCDDTGHLTMSPDIASYENGTLAVTVDLRIPATIPQEEVLHLIDQMGANYEILHSQNALYNDKESFLISTLRRVYEEQTGQSGEPIAIGGGTYARALVSGAGFGPQFPNEPSTIHQKDEFISLKNIEKLLNIYCAAIRELTR